jgi:AcrR family transcriptional regulator
MVRALSDRSRAVSRRRGAAAVSAPERNVRARATPRARTPAEVDPHGRDRQAGKPASAVPRGGVPEIQRARILAALVEVARERGAGRVTVAHIVERSGVSRRTFYELFADRDACFVAAFEAAVERAAASVVPAFRLAGARGDVTGSWRERIRAGLLALLEFLDAEPGLGGLCVVDALGAGPAALERRARVMRVLVDAVDGGRRASAARSRPARITAEGVVGGVLAVLYERLAGEDARPTVRLLNPLMAMIVLPYLGPAGADGELARSVPRARRRPARSPSNPLEGLEMRLTYRTVLVLRAISSLPGASNREVADAAGVVDQGQISKLLGRLAHLGLIKNGGAGPARGESNAWQLTSRGREVERTIRQQATPVVG